MKMHNKWLSTLLAVSLIFTCMLPQTAFANINPAIVPVQDMTAGLNPEGVGDTAYDVIATLGWNKAEGKSFHTDYKRIQFADLGGVDGQDAKITFRCAADEDSMLSLLSLMIGQESEFSYMELAMKIGNGSNFALQDGTRTIRVQYDGKLDFTATILFFNYGYVATGAQMTQYIAPVIAPAPVVSLTPVPSVRPTVKPEVTPSVEPSQKVEVTPSVEPSQEVVVTPSAEPSQEVEVTPSTEPSQEVEVTPSVEPSQEVEVTPSAEPGQEPVVTPGVRPGEDVTELPSNEVMQQPDEESAEKPEVTQPVQVDTVKNVKLSDRKKNQFTITWGKVKSADGYEIFLRKAGSKTYSKVATVTADSSRAVIKKAGKNQLSSGTIYEVVVRAYGTAENKTVYGSYSKTLSASTLLSTPVITVKSAGQKLSVQWRRVDKAQGYEIYLSDRKTKGYQKQKTVTGSQKNYTTRKLTANKTYYIKVRAYQLVNGEKVYSSYSTVKQIKNKK